MQPPLVGRLARSLRALVDIGPTLAQLADELGRTREAMVSVRTQLDRLEPLLAEAIAHVAAADRSVQEARDAVLGTSSEMRAEGERLRGESGRVRERLEEALVEVRRANDAASDLVGAAESVPGIDSEARSR